MKKDENPVLARIAALAPKITIDSLRILSVGETEHWVELMSGIDSKEKMLVTCSESEIEEICEDVRSALKRRQKSN